MGKRIMIVTVRRAPEENINQDLQWLGSSLGLFNARDKDSSCFRVFITLVKKAKRNEPISSDDIAERLRLSRGTVVHHLTRLIDSGIVVREQQGYLLRENTLQRVVEDIQRDIQKTFSDLMDVAKEIDGKLG